MRKNLSEALDAVRDEKNNILVKPLVNSKDGNYHWRIGHYRVLFDVNGKVILLLRMQHHALVYKESADCSVALTLSTKIAT